MQSGSPSPLWQGGCAALDVRLLRVEGAICGREESFRCTAVARVHGHADAHRKGRLLAVRSQLFGDALGHAGGHFLLRLDQENGELIPTVTCSRINRATVASEHASQPAERPAANEVAILVIDSF